MNKSNKKREKLELWIDVIVFFYLKKVRNRTKLPGKRKFDYTAVAFQLEASIRQTLSSVTLLHI